MQDFLLFFEKMFDITKNITKNGINAKNVMQRFIRVPDKKACFRP